MQKRKLQTFVLTYPEGREVKQIHAEELNALDALTYFRFKLGLRRFKALMALDCRVVKI